MANAFLAAKGYEVGRSKGDGDQVAVAAEVLAAAATARCELVLPRDLVVARTRRGGAGAASWRSPRSRPTRWRSTSVPRRSPTSRSTCAPPARSTGTGRWASSRSTTSAPARRPSARRSPRASAVTVAGGGDTVAAARRFGLEGSPHPRLHGRRRVDGVPGGPRAARRGGAHGPWGQHAGGAPAADGRQLEDVQDARRDGGVLA